MKKYIYSFPLFLLIAFATVSIEAGEIGLGNRNCVSTVENPCPEPSSPRDMQSPVMNSVESSENSSDNDSDRNLYEWLIKYLGF